MVQLPKIFTSQTLDDGSVQPVIKIISRCFDCDSKNLLQNKTFVWCIDCGWEQRLRPSASQRRNMADSVDG